MYIHISNSFHFTFSIYFDSFPHGTRRPKNSPMMRCAPVDSDFPSAQVAEDAKLCRHVPSDEDGAGMIFCGISG